MNNKSIDYKLNLLKKFKDILLNQSKNKEQLTND